METPDIVIERCIFRKNTDATERPTRLTVLEQFQRNALAGIQAAQIKQVFSPNDHVTMGKKAPPVSKPQLLALHIALTSNNTRLDP